MKIKIFITVILIIILQVFSLLNVVAAAAKILPDWQTMQCDILYFKEADEGVIYRCYDAEKDNYCYIVDIPFNGISCVKGK